MKTFQMDGKPEILEFTNYDREDEEILFDKIMKRLNSNPGIVIGKKQMGPSEDFYSCTLDGLPFTLCFDLDYGPHIYSENSEAIKQLIKYFE